MAGIEVPYNARDGSFWFLALMRRESLAAYDGCKFTGGKSFFKFALIEDPTQRRCVDILGLIVWRQAMNLSTEMFRLANDYISGTIGLDTLKRWMHDHLDDFAEMSSDDPLWGLLQLRIWDMDDGFTEEAFRSEIRAQLLDRTAKRQPRTRAAG